MDEPAMCSAAVCVAEQYVFLKYSSRPRIGHRPLSEPGMGLRLNLVRLTETETKFKAGSS